MIHSSLEAVSLVLIIGFTASLVIGIYKNAPPAPDREEERRTMRDERRRPPKEKR